MMKLRLKKWLKLSNRGQEGNASQDAQIENKGEEDLLKKKKVM